MRQGRSLPSTRRRQSRAALTRANKKTGQPLEHTRSHKLQLTHEEQAADTSHRNRALQEDTASNGQQRHQEGRATPRPATLLQQRDQTAVEGTTIPPHPGRGRRPTGQPDRAEKEMKQLEEDIDPPWREVTAGRRIRRQLGHQRLAAGHPPSHNPKRRLQEGGAEAPSPLNQGCGFSTESRGGRGEGDGPQRRLREGERRPKRRRRCGRRRWPRGYPDPGLPTPPPRRRPPDPARHGVGEAAAGAKGGVFISGEARHGEPTPSRSDPPPARCPHSRAEASHRA